MTIPLTEDSLNRHNSILNNVSILERNTSSLEKKVVAYWNLWHQLKDGEVLVTKVGNLTRKVCGESYEALTGEVPWLQLISSIISKHLTQAGDTPT